MQNYLECSPRRLPVSIPVHQRACAAFTLALAADARAAEFRATRRHHDVESHAAAIVDRAVRDTALPTYSIRVATENAKPCSACTAETGLGPVGYCGDSALCDRCLLEQCEPLGMLLALAAVTRAYAMTGTDDPDTARESLTELGGFARIFEQVIAKWGPARLITTDDPGNG